MQKSLLASFVLVVSSVAAAQPAEPAGQPEPEPAPVPEPPPAADPAPAPAPASPPVVPARRSPAAAEPPSPIAAPGEPVFAAWPTSRLSLDLVLVPQARWIRRAGDDLSELRLDRGELGARVALGRQAAAELRVEAIRSAAEGGALGIDGNTTVVRVRAAQVLGTVDAGPVRLEGALGFVPDPWVQTLEAGYPLRPLSRTGSERLLAWSPADLAAVGRASLGPVRLTVSGGNGEGLRFPERNRGKTTTVVLEVVPVHRRELRVTLAGVVRDGSIGVASIRDRRAGGGATARTPWGRAGIEAMRAWGLGDRGEIEGTLVAGWLESPPVARVFVSARAATLGLGGVARSSTLGGAVAFEPWRERGRMRLWLAIDRVTTSGAAMPIAGAEAGDATTAMFIASAEAPFFFD